MVETLGHTLWHPMLHNKSTPSWLFTIRCTLKHQQRDNALHDNTLQPCFRGYILNKGWEQKMCSKRQYGKEWAKSLINHYHGNYWEFLTKKVFIVVQWPFLECQNIWVLNIIIWCNIISGHLEIMYAEVWILINSQINIFLWSRWIKCF